MIRPDSFSSLNPIVSFTYFFSVITFSMFFMHPIFQIIGLVSAISYSLMIKGLEKGLKFNLVYMLPMLIFMAIINPLFNHEGVTILFYLNNGNPITLEAIIYGISAALMFITVIIWFSAYNTIMTSDKYMYLFGRIIPSLSLIFSMVLRFVPRYLDQIKKISKGQKALANDVSQGNIIRRAKNGIKILSIMVTWALENAIETSDSMKSRGYGLPGRTSFSLYKFDKRDKIIFGIILFLLGTILFGAYKGENTIKFYPAIKISEISRFSLAIYMAYGLLSLMPVIINIQEEIQWKYIELKI